MKVRDVMTTDNLLTIGQDDSLAIAAHRMTWTRCRHLPVVKDREVVGVIFRERRSRLAWRASSSRWPNRRRPRGHGDTAVGRVGRRRHRGGRRPDALLSGRLPSCRHPAAP